MKKQHTLKWFERRRGKFIYRQPRKKENGEKCCDMCEDTKVYVIPKMEKIPDHARHLFDYQNELKIFYQDKPIK